MKIVHTKDHYNYLRKSYKAKVAGYKAKDLYCVPKLSTKTDKGRWLNAFAKLFFGDKHNYNLDGKNVIKLKNAKFRINNDLNVMVGFFKNLKKLKSDNFVGEYFNSHLLQNMKETA